MSELMSHQLPTGRVGAKAAAECKVGAPPKLVNDPLYPPLDAARLLLLAPIASAIGAAITATHHGA